MFFSKDWFWRRSISALTWSSESAFGVELSPCCRIQDFVSSFTLRKTSSQRFTDRWSSVGTSSSWGEEAVSGHVIGGGDVVSVAGGEETSSVSRVKELSSVGAMEDASSVSGTEVSVMTT